MKVDSDIEQASTIPSAFYTSSEWYERSREKIFAKTWQFCLSLEDLRLTGSLVPYNLLPNFLDEPLLFVRDVEDTLHCISNVCTHRGNILVNAPCIDQHIKCRYHGRRFNLQGKFLHMPEFEKAKNFPSANENLPNIPFEQLGQFIFAAIDPIVPFEEVFKDILQRLHWMPFDKLRIDPNRSRDYLVKAHWALYCENYLDALHIPFIHRSLRSTLDFKHYSTEIYRYTNLQLAIAGDGCESFDLPESSIDYGKDIAAYYFWIFPNTMLNFYPWGCSVNVVQPLGLSLTKVSFLTYVLDENKLDHGAGGNLDRIEREDEAVVETVQKGIRSRYYHSGRYSPTFEQGTHHFHQLLCEFLS